MALRLGEDDPIIRRRLRQKLEFVAEDVTAQIEPTEAELAAYLQANPEVFRVDARITFSQVFFDPGKRGASLANDITLLLTKLNQPGDQSDIAQLGDSRILEPVFEGIQDWEIAKQFGEKFSVELNKLALGRWQGPIESGYGVHLVKISERRDGRIPALADVRATVRREWDNAQRLAMNERFYDELLKRYTVTIEPTPTAVQK